MSSAIKKVLIIRLGAIGDVVHSTIILNAIKQKHPNCEIHFLTSHVISPLLINHPFVDKVWAFNNNKRSSVSYLFELGYELRKENFDLTINLTKSLRNFFLTFLVNSKKSISKSNSAKHCVVNFFNCAQKAFKDLTLPDNLTLDFNEDLKKEVDEILKPHKHPYVIFNPGGENDLNRQGRTWPLEKWIDLAHKLKEKYNASIIIAGSKNEMEYHKPLTNVANSVMLTGKLELDKSAVLYSKCDLLISGDSGPLHIASALKVNIIGLYGSTDPEICAPFGKNNFVISPENTECKFCHKKICTKISPGEVFTPCMKNIEVSQVIDLINKESLL